MIVFKRRIDNLVTFGREIPDFRFQSTEYIYFKALFKKNKFNKPASSTVTTNNHSFAIQRN